MTASTTILDTVDLTDESHIDVMILGRNRGGRNEVVLSARYGKESVSPTLTAHKARALAHLLLAAADEVDSRNAVKREVEVA